MRVGSDLDLDRVPDVRRRRRSRSSAPRCCRASVATASGRVSSRSRSVDGAEFPVSVVTFAHRDESGVVDFFSTIARDITPPQGGRGPADRERVVVPVLVNEALDVVSVRDADEQHRLRQPVGAPGARVRGRRDRRRVESDRSRSTPTTSRCSAEPKPRPGPSRDARCAIEYRLRHQDRSWRWVESRITNLLDDPAVHGIVTNSQDVTDRRSAEDARARSDSALLALVQASPLAIHSVEADLSVQLWNNACEELFGWSAGEVLGRRPPFVPDDARSRRPRI